MATQDNEERGSIPARHGELTSPFLDEELFAAEADPEREAHLSVLEAESPFQNAFEEEIVIPGEIEAQEQDSADEDEWFRADDFLAAEVEAQDEDVGPKTENEVETRHVEAGPGHVEEELDDIFEDEGLPEEAWISGEVTGRLTDFVPTAVESPGGGRIQDKRDPPPEDLETVKGHGGKQIQLHRLAAAAWGALVAAARRDAIGEPLLLPTSGYRSTQRQAELFRAAVERYRSEREARKWVAPPGASAHHSGRAIDFYLGGSNSSVNVAALQRKPVYLWLAKYAREFGFYPYDREPWHWEYNPPATLDTQNVGASAPSAPTFASAQRPTSDTARLPAEQVRFAQRVLNATEGEKLKVDADLGRLTRGALERFRRKHGLGTGGVLDEKTEIALVQRALEELRQQSLFGTTGVLDAATQRELIDFKSARGLDRTATLDPTTLRALGEAVERRAGVATGSAPSVAPPAATPPDIAPGGLPKLGAGLTPPADPGAYRRFRLTTYHVVEQHDYPTGSIRVPIYDPTGQKLAESSPEFFGKLSLQGSGLLADGRLVNVTGKRVPVAHDEYAAVLAYHRRAYAKRDERLRKEGRAPTPTTYSGIVVKDERVRQALAFHEVPANRRGIGYGMQRDIAHMPFRTLAADIGHPKYTKVDPIGRGKGGLVPPGTHVYIKEFDGLRLPDDTTHNGWFIVNDTGGAIFGVHFDVFVGTQALGKRVKLPEFGQVWFAGIEQRIPPGHAYGLKP
jgi:hypothetical protein